MSEPGTRAAGVDPLDGLAADDAIRAATGRGWAEWAEWLNAAGAAELPHGKIVTLLGGAGAVESGWWRQMVATGYERLIGRRALGEVAGGGFQIGVRRTLRLAPDEAWRRVLSPEGVAGWLGEPEEPIAWEPGSAFRLRDGAIAEVRVHKPGSHFRLQLREPGADKASVIQVRVNAAATGSVISFHQEQLPSAESREERRVHFASALDVLADLG
ncbi:hypothetical protein [Longimicrobium terrae]|uniref:SRPBCC domain-containing protein n=1 Tax=Longimicrobium terrae TaxID=1639882 RepID=A0A841GKW2_9BACT|nr:hypothetical protein [Longimicrobium terrae]MBB4634987.1 hypothetical protein [Longimicrobium terrae]MBB6069381.1 hypothetical protein [Longimicrobium terrae]NNC31813.1 hypothetical protein [Longimicrobium terrae]